MKVGKRQASFQTDPLGYVTTANLSYLHPPQVGTPPGESGADMRTQSAPW